MITHTPEQCAWTAGIIDGEGTIGIYPRYRTDVKCQNPGWGMVVKVGNTDSRMTKALRDIWGGSGHDAVDTREGRSVCYTWTIAAKQALAMLREIRQYLVTKRAQADLAIQFQSQMGRGPKPTSPEAYAIKRGMYYAMKALNLKGPWKFSRRDITECALKVQQI